MPRATSKPGTVHSTGSFTRYDVCRMSSNYEESQKYFSSLIDHRFEVFCWQAFPQPLRLSRTETVRRSLGCASQVASRIGLRYTMPYQPARRARECLGRMSNVVIRLLHFLWSSPPNAQPSRISCRCSCTTLVSLAAHTTAAGSFEAAPSHNPDQTRHSPSQNIRKEYHTSRSSPQTWIPCGPV